MITTQLQLDNNQLTVISVNHGPWRTNISTLTPYKIKKQLFRKDPQDMYNYFDISPNV